MKSIPEGGRRLRRLLRCLLLTAGVVALDAVLAFDLILLGHCWTHAREERAGWIADYYLLRESVEAAYPNLEWTIEHGTPVLPELDRQTTARLEAALTRAEARQAIRDFVNAFADGHFGARPPARPSFTRFRQSVGTLTRDTPAISACATLGYDRSRAAKIPFDFEGLAQFAAFDDANAFRAGVLVLGSHRLGFVRLASFAEARYASSCRDEWDRFRATLVGTCEERCRERFRLALDNRLILHFESRIRKFRSADVELVLVDLTRNSGGHPWADALGRVLIGRDLPFPPRSFVRGYETVAELDNEMKHVDRALALCPAQGPGRRALEATYLQLDAARSDALAPCPRWRVWHPEEPRFVCSQLTSPLRLDREALGELDTEPEEMQRMGLNLLEPVRYRRPRIAWRGRLVVLIDKGTASRAELFAGGLKDYGGAVLIGEVTSGCGAGWHRDDLPMWLEHVGLELHIPDSVAYRRDGTSYRNGVRPDISAGWKETDTDSLRARRLIKALRQLFGAPSS